MHHPPHNIDWDTLRIFLAVKRLRSFRGASSELGVASATVARAIDRLEDQLGFKLLIRDPDGVRLTTEGRRLSESIDNAEKAIFDVWRSAALANETLAGSIRLAVTEGLGTFWLMPRLATYIRENPRVNIELQAAMKSVDVLRFESDISIQFTEPKGKDLVVEQLGWLHLTWFASQEYIDRRGMCTSFQDLANHLIVEQQTDQLHSYRLDELFGPGSTERMMRLKTNFSSAHYWAVAKGVGIGLLPSYARLIGGRVVYMPTGFQYPVKIFMAVHPDVAGNSRHRKFMGWLRDAFSPEKYPWFRQDFISPTELDNLPLGPEMTEYFSGFVASRETIPARLPVSLDLQPSD